MFNANELVYMLRLLDADMGSITTHGCVF